jgi:hypothetical protein
VISLKFSPPPHVYAESAKKKRKRKKGEIGRGGGEIG